eukprot:FR741496.1.p1 GENE.FR741496.1~~FR741496.1.p1  ORF type:complete len:207 (+),score=14.92 FR741496.1:68-688(+)
MSNLMGDLAAALSDRRKNERAKRDARMAKATVQEGAKNKPESMMSSESSRLSEDLNELPVRPSMDGIRPVTRLVSKFRDSTGTVAPIAEEDEGHEGRTPLEMLQKGMQGKLGVKPLAASLGGQLNGNTPFGIANSAVDVRERMKGRELTKADTPIAATLSRPTTQKKKRRPPKRKPKFESADSQVIVEPGMPQQVTHIGGFDNSGA